MPDRPEAVLFDMGGVLLDAADRWDADGFNRSFPDGLPIEAPLDWFLDLSESILSTFIAIPPPRPAIDIGPFVAAALRECGPDVTPEAIALWHGILAQWESRPIYPFVRDTLGQLQAMGFRMGVISNNVVSGPCLEDHFRHEGIADYFDVIVFSANFGVNKPDPRIFRHALEGLGVSPEKAWYVGDKPQRDVCGAHTVGMTAVLVDSAHHGHIDDAPENKPDLTIPDISALPDLLATSRCAEA